MILTPLTPAAAPAAAPQQPAPPLGRAMSLDWGEVFSALLEEEGEVLPLSELQPEEVVEQEPEAETPEPDATVPDDPPERLWVAVPRAAATPAFDAALVPDSGFSPPPPPTTTEAPQTAAMTLGTPVTASSPLPQAPMPVVDEAEARLPDAPDSGQPDRKTPALPEQASADLPPPRPEAPPKAARTGGPDSAAQPGPAPQDDTPAPVAAAAPLPDPAAPEPVRLEISVIPASESGPAQLALHESSFQMARTETVAATSRMTLTQPVLAQIAEVLADSPPGQVELRLSPEELGRVQLRLGSSQNDLVVFVQAERPETLELFRRNIEGLAQEFRNIGFGGIAFHFGQSSGGGAPNPRSHTATAEAEPAPVTPSLARTLTLPPASGLDLLL
ncbi:flagellar hook-length control protein FliK [Halodurantibacterium flavum]|uniref:Flagellar hook-length control protein FliK n=1 Tax=Halodurantibacterium flavum TaxID=1382802 RepID=A0ABW4S906_9RHOB